MSGERWIAYNFAFLRVVPHVHLGAFTNVGVVVHARTADFLGMRTILDPRVLEECVPGVDHELLARYLRACEAICRGDAEAGPVALVSASERFHWLTAPRSDVLQPSPVHVGLCLDPAGELESLFRSCLPRNGDA
jgi:hypothetical protein